MTRLGSVSTRRLYATYTQRPSPPKSHLHAPLPPSSLPKGYVLTGVHAGVKKDPSKLDLAVILSTTPRGSTSAAACFTRNAFQAAPVRVSEEVLEKTGGRVRGVVVNSGCANAVTGKQGWEDAWGMVRATDALLSAQDGSASAAGEEETLVMSTGVIGQNLPISKILSSLRSPQLKSELGSDFGSWEKAAKAFMTTDTFPKLRSRTFKIGGREYRMAGMDKGAGMIHPDMRAAGTFDVPLNKRTLHPNPIHISKLDSPAIGGPPLLTPPGSRIYLLILDGRTTGQYSSCEEPNSTWRASLESPSSIVPPDHLSAVPPASIRLPESSAPSPNLRTTAGQFEPLPSAGPTDATSVTGALAGSARVGIASMSVDVDTPFRPTALTPTDSAVVRPHHDGDSQVSLAPFVVSDSSPWCLSDSYANLDEASQADPSVWTHSRTSAHSVLVPRVRCNSI
ncbi:hypothetical protein NMY22_g18646 [Coprinellus aureogranulatus]|nr:hypothetical protein NMY22_g18646 [Coprinellus aureogranulatus]